MAQFSYRANLSAAIFPMTIARAGRSVIIPQADQNFDRRVDPEGEQKSAGIPQIIYGENILPTADGYQSVGYASGGTFGPVAPGFSWAPITVNIPDSGRKHIVLMIGAGSVKSTYDGINYSDAIIVGALPIGPGNFISTATVRGVCYLHVGIRIYTVTGSGPVTLTEVTASFTPVGILTNLVNICGAFNYLVLLKSDGTVNWSSTTTPTDFTPSLVSGAGSGAITGNAGATRYLRANPTGFYVYCFGNVVNVAYTGNARYPWRFIPVEDSEGVTIDNKIAGEPTDSRNFIVSQSGTILQITQQSAAISAPEVSELLTRLKYRDVFNYATNTFSVTASQGYANCTLSYLMERFIILSDNGVGIVYDIMFKRYGKVNVAHQYVIDVEPTVTGSSRVLAFIDLEAGVTKLLVQDVNDTSVTMQGVMLLGKMQYVRSRFLCLDELSVECSQLQPLVSPIVRNFSVYAISTLDGKTFQPSQQLYEISSDSSGAVMSYFSSAEGKNVSVLIKGAFDLSTVDMRFHLGGDC